MEDSLEITIEKYLEVQGKNEELIEQLENEIVEEDIMNLGNIMEDEEVFNYHGWREQCKHIISEVYELAEAVHDFEKEKYLCHWDMICEEIADVSFMLNQFKEKYKIEPKYMNSWLDFKRKRETERIKNGYYEK